MGQVNGGRYGKTNGRAYVTDDIVVPERCEILGSRDFYLADQSDGVMTLGCLILPGRLVQSITFIIPVAVVFRMSCPSSSIAAVDPQR
jgi:hypothetical protein